VKAQGSKLKAKYFNTSVFSLQGREAAALQAKNGWDERDERDFDISLKLNNLKPKTSYSSQITAREACSSRPPKAAHHGAKRARNL